MRPEIIFFSDTHLGFDHPQKPRTNRLVRGEDFFRNFERVLAQARERQVAAVIHGGDLFHRSRPPQPIIDRAYDALWKTAEAGVRIIVNPGNHERSTLPGSLFLHHPHIHVAHRPSLFGFEVENTSVAVACMPFFRNLDRTYFAQLAQLAHNTRGADARLLCVHQNIQGATVGTGNLGGVFRFPPGPHNLDPERIPKGIHQVLCGHIHRHQMWTNRHGTQFLFPGSTERTSFAEAEETKGYLSLFLNDGDLTPAFRALPSRPMRTLDAFAIHPRQRATLLEQLRNGPPSVLRLPRDAQQEQVLAFARDFRTADLPHVTLQWTARSTAPEARAPVTERMVAPVLENA